MAVIFRKRGARVSVDEGRAQTAQAFTLAFAADRIETRA
jgi:hypothetical protein